MLAVCFGVMSLSSSDETYTTTSPLGIEHSPTQALVGIGSFGTSTTIKDSAGSELPGEEVRAFVIDLETASTTPAAAAVSAQWSPTEAMASDGVLALFSSEAGVPLANGIVIDNLVLTSASSVGDRDQVFASLDSQWVAFDVIAADPYTDIAVLQTDMDIQLTSVVTTPGGPVASPGQSVAVLGAHHEVMASAAQVATADVAQSTSAPAEPSGKAASSEAASSDTEPGSVYGITSDLMSSVGELVATDKRTTSATGFEILGAILTTCRNNGLLAGAALVDHEGYTLGIVVNSEDQLAMAIPLEVAIEIGRSLTDEGWRGGAWLGVTAHNVDRGLQIDDVALSGPAADAGLQTGDLVTGLNGQPLGDMASLLRTLRTLASGDVVSIEIERPTESGEIELVVIQVQLSEKELAAAS